MKSVSGILHTCATLDMATIHSQKCCERLVDAGAINTLLQYGQIILREFIRYVKALNFIIFLYSFYRKMVQPKKKATVKPKQQAIPQNVTVIEISPDTVEKQKLEALCSRKKKPQSSLASTLTAQSKAARGLNYKPVPKNIVDIGAQDVDNELAAVEYVEDIYKLVEPKQEKHQQLGFCRPSRSNFKPRVSFNECKCLNFNLLIRSSNVWRKTFSLLFSSRVVSFLIVEITKQGKPSFSFVSSHVRASQVVAVKQLNHDGLQGNQEFIWTHGRAHFVLSLTLIFEIRLEGLETLDHRDNCQNGTSNGFAGGQTKTLDLTGWELALVSTPSTDVSSFQERQLIF